MLDTVARELTVALICSCSCWWCRVQFIPGNSTADDRLPVMVYVHGGGGTVGSGKMYSKSSSLVKKGVILVVCILLARVLSVRVKVRVRVRF